MNPSPEGGSRKNETLVTMAVAAAIATVVVAYYSPFVHNFFDYDDFRYIENMYKGFLDILLGYGSFRILANLSWWPLFSLSGFNPVGYNVFSFGMLFIDALLLYFLVRSLFADTAIAALTAVLFAGGSVGADAIFWKCTNSTLICFFFYVVSLLGLPSMAAGGNRRLVAASLAAFLLAILSKEEAASLPGVIILVELCLLGERHAAAIAKRIAPFCAIIPHLCHREPPIFQSCRPGA